MRCIAYTYNPNNQNKFTNKILYNIFISMPVRTSNNFYRRGVPNAFNNFGYIASGNYTVGYPTSVKINTTFFQSQFNAIINQR